MTLLFAALVALVGILAAGVAAISGFGIGSLLTPVLAIQTGTKVAVAAVAIPHVVATAQQFWVLRTYVDRRVLLGFSVASGCAECGGAARRRGSPAPSRARSAAWSATRAASARRRCSASTSRWPLVLVATVAVVIGTVAGTKLLGHLQHTTFRRMIGALAVASCARDRATASSASTHTPQARRITITTVPLLVKEQEGVLPFLREDVDKGGVLEGKEVYAFSPSTITVVEGDTIHFTFINPEDDVHSFVLPDLAVSLPAQKTTTATYVAKHAGIYPFVCAIQSHLPMMSGQLVVRSAASVAAR